MKVENVKVYDLEESIVASGLPMRTESDPRKMTEKDLKRCVNLVNATKGGNGAHAQFLTGIRVAFDLTFSNKAWVEMERYQFIKFVSSQSTMHRITKFALGKAYNRFVDSRIVAIMKEKVEHYNNLLDAFNNMAPDDPKRVDANNYLKELYLEILYSNPAGFELTARLTTDYRCLRNIYIQRKDHRLPEWREFCKWIETLPYAEEFLIS